MCAADDGGFDLFAGNAISEMLEHVTSARVPFQINDISGSKCNGGGDTAHRIRSSARVTCLFGLVFVTKMNPATTAAPANALRPTSGQSIDSPS